jgi:hypothetical protein
MSLLQILDGLDQMQKLLEEEFLECKIGYCYRSGHVAWAARLGAVLSRDSPDAPETGSSGLTPRCWGRSAS